MAKYWTNNEAIWDGNVSLQLKSIPIASFLCCVWFLTEIIWSEESFLRWRHHFFALARNDFEASQRDLEGAE